MDVARSVSQEDAARGHSSKHFLLPVTHLLTPSAAPQPGQASLSASSGKTRPETEDTCLGKYMVTGDPQAPGRGRFSGGRPSRPVCEPGPWAAGLAPSGELSRPCSFLGCVLWSQMLYRAHLPVHREQRWAPQRRPDGKAESPSRPPPCDRAGVGEPCTQTRAQPPPPHLLFLENNVRSQENGRTPRAILLGLGLPPGLEPARRPRPVLPVRRSGTCLCLRRGLSTSPVPLPQ